MSAPQTPPPTPAPNPAPVPTAAVPAVPTLPTVATPANPAPPTQTAPVAATSTPITPPNPVPPAAPTPPAQATEVPVPSAVTPATQAAAPNPLPPAAPNDRGSDAAQAEQAKEVKKAKSAYNKAKISRMFGRLRRHITFFILCGLFLFTSIWMFARSWQDEKAGLNENWFHEGLFLILMILSLVIFYYRLYRKSDVYQKAMAKKEAAEKAAREARLKLEEEQKKQAFMGLIKDFQSASSYEQKSATMAKLLTVGLESNLLRQQALDLLCDLNLWMANEKAFLSTQNLIVWRLKSSLFEQSERFQVDSATQDLTIKSVNIIEAIVKKHISEFTNGRTKTMLDLTNKNIPTLTLTAQVIPEGCVSFDGSILWQASFAETELTGLSFVGADLQAASFWRAQLNGVNFEGANLQFSKLRTNLQDVLNMNAEQFFGSKEWELCYLSPEQKTAFFSDTEHMPPGAQSNWDSAEPRRRKLYFHLLRQQSEGL